MAISWSRELFAFDEVVVFSIRIRPYKYLQNIYASGDITLKVGEVKWNDIEIYLNIRVFMQKYGITQLLLAKLKQRISLNLFNVYTYTQWPIQDGSTLQNNTICDLTRLMNK